MPLKLSLRPGEKFVVNGAVVQNGDRRAALVLQNKASVLREKDIMQPNEADTPAKRIYFPIMLMYLDDSGRDKAYGEFAARLAEFMGAVRDHGVLTECIGVSQVQNVIINPHASSSGTKPPCSTRCRFDDRKISSINANGATIAAASANGRFHSRQITMNTMQVLISISPVMEMPYAAASRVEEPNAKVSTSTPANRIQLTCGI